MVVPRRFGVAMCCSKLYSQLNDEIIMSRGFKPLYSVFCQRGGLIHEPESRKSQTC